MGRRGTLHLEGLQHGAPIPSGAVAGNLVFFSATSGRDPRTGVAPADPDDRPARRAMKADMRGDVHFQLEVIALLSR